MKFWMSDIDTTVRTLNIGKHTKNRNKRAFFQIVSAIKMLSGVWNVLVERENHDLIIQKSFLEFSNINTVAFVNIAMFCTLTAVLQHENTEFPFLLLQFQSGAAKFNQSS